MEQWTRDTVTHLSEQLQELTRSMADVRERLIRIEASPVHRASESHAAEITRLWAKVANLELQIVQRAAAGTGWSAALDWVYKLAPWAALIVVAVSGNISIGL
jgi:hypothetical protein